MGYDDFDETTAQKTSCLDLKLFKRTLATVQKALAAKQASEVPRTRSVSRIPSEPSRSSDVGDDEKRAVRDSFYPIIEKHRLGHKKRVATWMGWLYWDMKKYLVEEAMKASEQDLKMAAYASVIEMLKVRRG